MMKEVRRMNFQFGDLIFVKGGTFLVSSAIKKITHSPYSHVAIAVAPDLICEIDVFSKMKIRPNHYKNYDVFRYFRPLSSQEQNQMMQFLLKKIHCSKGYDWGKILEMFMRYVFHYNTYIDLKNREICSELADLAYQSIQIDLVPGKRDGDVSPEDLVESPYIFKIKEIREYAS